MARTGVRKALTEQNGCTIIVFVQTNIGSHHKEVGPVTFAIAPRHSYTVGSLARLTAAVASAVKRQPAASIAPQPAVNEGRWAPLPGEYAGPWHPPIKRTLPAITAPGETDAIECAAHGPAVLHLAGVWSGQVAFEGSADGKIWIPMLLTSLMAEEDATEATGPGLWKTFPDQHIRFLRLRVRELSVGSIVVTVAAAPAFATDRPMCLDSAA